MLGLIIKPTIGIGDAIQFTSVPENYFRATGEKLVDVNKYWGFDHNPYVVRDVPYEKEIDLWNYNPRYMPRNSVYQSLAEKHCGTIGVPVVMKYPRLYKYETDTLPEERQMILLHTSGVSHGEMPQHVIDHVKEKYKDCFLYHIGLPGCKDIGIPKLATNSLWGLAKIISGCRLFIGMDSGPSWIANCYPDVVVKKLRTKPTPEHFKDWIPLDVHNIHAQWDDREHHVYNITEDDIGFTNSYRRI